MISKVAVCVLICLLMMALHTFASADEQSIPTAITALPPDHVIVFGEMHGVREVPEFFADQVETLLQSGRSVRVGLELNSDDTGALNAAMMLANEAALHRELMTLRQWREGTDSRNGIAMSRMLLRFGQLIRQYPGKLRVFAFDIPWGSRTTPNERDAHMTTQVGRQRELADDDEYVVVLVGNAHAFAVPGAPWDEGYRSMVVQLMSDFPVISLRNAQSGGQAWLCLGEPECGPAPLADLGERLPGIYLEPYSMNWAGDEPVYHGLFFYGQGSVSEPLPVWLEQQDKAGE